MTALAAAVVVLCAVAVVVVVGLSGLTRSALVSGLQAAGGQRSAIVVSGLFQPSDASSGDGGQIGRVLRRTLAPVGGRVMLVAQSSTYDLPGRIGAGSSQTTVFWSVPDPAGRLRLLSGIWPRAAAAVARGGTVPVAVPAAVARQFDLAPGDRFRVRSRLDGSRVRVVVTGVWVAQREPGNAVRKGGWADDPLVRRGHTGDAAFSTWGPLLVPRDRFADVGSSGTVQWRAVPRWSGATTASVSRLRDRTARLDSRVVAAVEHRQHPEAVQVQDPLPGLLAGQLRALVVFRSLVLVPAGLVAAVALAGLLLTAALLAVARAPEEVLLRSRGAGPWQLVRPSAVEAGVIAVVGVVAGPWVAVAVLGWVWRPVWPGAQAWVAAAATAAVCAVALTIPSAVRAARGYDVHSGEEATDTSWRAVAARVAAVVVLVALGVLAADQLRRYGIAAAGSGGRGGLGVDPLLVAAPAVVLTAGVVLVELGVVPLARSLAGLAARSRGLALLVGSNSVARDLSRSLPVAIVVALAAGSATFATEQVASQEAARAARAAYVTGGDVQVHTPPPAHRRGTFTQWRELTSTPGVTGAAAVYRSTDNLQQRRVQTLAVDLSQLAGTALAPGSGPSGLPPDVVERLRSRPWRHGPVVPAGAASRVRVGATSSVGHISRVVPVLADSSGMPFPAEQAAGGKARHAGGAPRMQLVAVAVTVDTPACTSNRRPPPATTTVRLTGVRAGGRSLHTGAPRWLRPGAGSPTPPRASVTVPPCREGGSSTLLALFGHSPAGLGDIPAVVTGNVAGDLGVGVGDTFEQSTFGLSLTLKVVGVRPRLATVDRPDGGILIDAAAVVPRLLRAGLDAAPGQWWLTLGGHASPAAVAHRVAALAGVSESVTTRAQVRERLDASAAAGGRGLTIALWVGAGVAVGLTGLLLIVGTVLRRPERRHRSGLLVILGAARRDVLAALGWEQLLTAAAGAVGGAGLGTVAVWLMLGPLTLDATGDRIVPPPSLQVAGAALTGLLAVLLVVPVLTVLVVARRDLAGTDLTAVGRQGL